MREIHCKVLNLSCVYQGEDHMTPGKDNMNSFIRSMSNPDSSLFNMELMQVVVASVKDDYFSQINKNVFLPFCAEIVIFNLYCYLLTLQDQYSAFDLLSFEFYVRHMVLALALFFACVEYFQGSYVGAKEYFGDPFNFINILGIASKMLVVFMFGYNLDTNRSSMYVILSISVFLAWMNAMFWIRFFESMSHYFHMIIVTFEDILEFLGIQALFMCMFGFSLFYLSLGKVHYDAAEVIPEHFSSNVVNIAMDQYLLLLGEFQGLDDFDGDYAGLVWIIFFMATFISQVIIFNMLIAIMGDSYAKV